MRVCETRSRVQCCAIPHENPSAPIPRNNRMWQVQREKALGYVREKCQRSARYEVDGKSYCAMHAGKIALDFMLRQIESTEMRNIALLNNQLARLYKRQVDELRAELLSLKGDPA